MKPEPPLSFRLRFRRMRAASAALSLFLAAAVTVGGVVPVIADAVSKAASSGLTANQRIIHLLNRIGYGPRPGDVERVKQMGIDKYIDLQLHPERIDDSGIEAKLANYPS